MIGRVDHIKFLGVFVDENLTYGKHIDVLSTNLSRCVGLLYKLSKFMPTCAMENIYFSLFHSHLQYCTEVWCSASQTHVNRIFVIQKKAIRAVHNLPYNSHTSAYFSSMNIMRLCDLYKYKSSVYLFKVINLSYDRYFLNLIQAAAHNHSHNLRNNLITLPFYHHAKTQSSFLYRAISFYNSLPVDIKACNRLSIFASKLKQLYCV